MTLALAILGAALGAWLAVFQEEHRPSIAVEVGPSLTKAVFARSLLR